MRTGSRVEYMAFPRMLALAEVVWSPASARDWDHFKTRLPAQVQRPARLGVNYRLPDVEGIGFDRLTLETVVTVELRAPVPGGVIRHALDGSDPTARSAEYRTPLAVRVDSGPVTVAARVFSGRRAGAERRSTIRQTTHEPAVDVDTAALQSGLRRTDIAGEFHAVDQLERGTRTRSAVASRVGLPGSPPEERPGARPDTAGRLEAGGAGPYGVIFTGYLRVPADDVYTFWLTSDDGSGLVIDGRQVVDNDGLHSATARDGQVALAAGLHDLELRYFQAGGGQALELLVGTGDSEPHEVPERWLYHAAGR